MEAVSGTSGPARPGRELRRGPSARVRLLRPGPAARNANQNGPGANESCRQNLRVCRRARRSLQTTSAAWIKPRCASIRSARPGRFSRPGAPRRRNSRRKAPRPASTLPSPFIEGRERFAPQTLHEARQGEAWQVRVVPNRAPILQIEGDAARHPDGFYDRTEGVGAHEVIIETPGMLAFEDLTLREIERVIAAWKFRMLDLMRDPRLRSFTVLKNVGRAAGGTVPHAVSQLLAMAVIPPALKRKLEVARAFYRVKKRSIFEDILAEEVRTARRLVYENNGFAVFCPYAARVPFRAGGLSEAAMPRFPRPQRPGARPARRCPPHRAAQARPRARASRLQSDAFHRAHAQPARRRVEHHRGRFPLAHRDPAAPAARRRRGAGDRLLGEQRLPGDRGRLPARDRGPRRFAAMKAQQVFYEGRVQGVGFRWTVKNVAQGFDVTGWVRNLPDGRVELQAQGEAEEVSAFLEAVAESELKGHIKKIEAHPATVEPAARGFQIAR